MLYTMNIFVDPKTLAEEWDSYWLSSILVEYDVEHDPQIQAYYNKQMEASRRKEDLERERAESRKRAGSNHLEAVEKDHSPEVH